MPLYEYRCTSCSSEVDVIHGIGIPGPATCEVCGGVLRKAMSTPAIHFKGSGWAKKDAQAASKAKATKPAESGSDSSKGAADKPASSSEDGSGRTASKDGSGGTPSKESSTTSDKSAGGSKAGEGASTKAPASSASD